MNRFLAVGDTDLRAHTLWLRRLAARLVNDPPRAEDAVQDTLVAALTHPPALDRDVRPWLARVLANFTRSDRRTEQRRRKREQAVAAQDHEAVPGADELLLRHEAAHVVSGLVSRLREPHRGLVLLRFAEGLTSGEIARRQSVPEGTVRRQLKEALDELRAAVAAHYGRDARDWRLALVPLLRPGRADEALVGAWKEVALMAMKSKTKVLLTIGVAVLLALVVARSGFWPANRELTAEQPAMGGGPARGSAAQADPVHPAQGAATAVRSAQPPVFTGGQATPEPADCPARLAELRGLAARRTLVSPGAFASAKPSPATERQIAPIVEQMMSARANKPSYQLECRASLCRVSVVTDPDDDRGPPTWLRDLGKNGAFAALRGPNRSARVESAPTRDALTGAALLQHSVYFSVPLAAGEEHPFEASANATTCAERVAAMQKALEEQGDEEQRQRSDHAQRQRQFQAMPVNPELTRRVERAFRPLMQVDAGAPIGAWQCRGERECRWQGPPSAARLFDRRVDEALATQGLAAEQVMARIQAKPPGTEASEAEVLLRLGDGENGLTGVADYMLAPTRDTPAKVAFVGLLQKLTADSRGTYTIIKNPAGALDDAGNVVTMLYDAPSIPYHSPDLRYGRYFQTISMTIMGLTDSRILNYGSAARCNLTVNPTSTIFGAPFLDNAALTFWADNYDPNSQSAEGWVSSPEDCTTKKRKFATGIDQWFIRGDDQLVYTDGVQGEFSTLRVAKITAGDLGPGEIIQSGIPRQSWGLLPNQAAVLYQIRSSTEAADGIYYHALK